ncbi:hypothetical protein LguiB_011890 [Lonicera macranthoides]
MLSKAQSGKKTGEDSSNGKLLNEIEAISKALYSDKIRHRSSVPTLSSQSKSVGKSQLLRPKAKVKDEEQDPLRKEKKSIWNWRPLKAITQVRDRRLNCCFTLQVHSIEGLPLNFGDLSLRVHWKRRDGELVTRPARVLQGIAEFEEELKRTCLVNGTRNGPHHSAKYESKHFLLYASVFGAPELDLGKHRVDLTRLLPLTLEELEEEKSSGKWSTSYRLSGKAKGATMKVSFGYSVIENVPEGLSLRQNGRELVKSVVKFGQSDDRSAIRRGASLPVRSHTSSLSSLEDIKDLHEVLPTSRSELSDSVNILYKKLDEENWSKSVNCKTELDIVPETLEPLKENSFSSDTANNVESECEVSEFSVTEVKSEEMAFKVTDDSLGPSLDLPEVDGSIGLTLEEGPNRHSPVKDIGSDKDEPVVTECSFKGYNSCNKESLMQELESALNSLSDSVNERLDCQDEEHEISNQEDYLELKLNHKATRKGESLSLDDVTESIACDFLDLLGIEHSPFGVSSESEPDSPRERLLRQFEKDTLANGCSLFNFDLDGDLAEFGGDDPSVSRWGPVSEDREHPSVEQSFEEIQNTSSEAMRNKTKASMLEDLETEVLMHEWGLNEKAFQSSPPKGSVGFGSPIDLPPEEVPQLPPLGDGLGPYVQTSNGGFLRSMNPEIFSNAKSKGSLIMQVSSPVVVPAEMGSGIIEILQRLASVGIEKLSMQANKLMPLEDINGKTMQQIAWEAAPSLEAPESHVLLEHETEFGQNASNVEMRAKQKPSGPSSGKFGSSSSTSNEMESEYVSLEDLAPLAMDKIEALSIEGLRIQSDMSAEDAPSNITPQSNSEPLALKGTNLNIGGSIGLEGAGGLQLMDIKDSSDDVDGLMGLSLTLDEWMRLDSGEIDDGDEISERTSKILAAHHASDLMRVRSKGDRRRGKGSKKCGLLGNNFTVALMVQLRDPLRNYEPVGTPMLALIQVERVFIPPKPKIYSTVSIVKTRDEDKDESEPAKKEIIEEKIQEEEVIPQFKITEVHVAGFKAEPGKKKLWGSKTPQQSGSRWLLANGMGKNNKHPLMKSKANAKSSSPATTTVQPGETLWSISSRVHGTGAKWKDLAKLNPHIRNPNVIFPNETIRLS